MLYRNESVVLDASYRDVLKQKSGHFLKNINNKRTSNTVKIITKVEHIQRANGSVSKVGVARNTPMTLVLGWEEVMRDFSDPVRGGCVSDVCENRVYAYRRYMRTSHGIDDGISV